MSEVLSPLQLAIVGQIIFGKNVINNNNLKTVFSNTGDYVFAQCSLVMIINASRQPNFLTFEDRISTFTNNLTLQNLMFMPKQFMQELAESGFYVANEKLNITDNNSPNECLKCFFCSVKMPINLTQDSLSVRAKHRSKSPRCFLCKLHCVIVNETDLSRQEDIAKSEKAWIVAKKEIELSSVVETVQSYGFVPTLIRIAMLRYFVFSNGKFGRPGDIIQLIYDDLQKYNEFMRVDSLVNVLDPLKLINSLLKSITMKKKEDGRILTTDSSVRYISNNYDEEPRYSKCNRQRPLFSGREHLNTNSNSNSNTCDDNDSGCGSSITSSISSSTSSLDSHNHRKVKNNNLKKQLDPIPDVESFVCTHGDNVKTSNSKALVLLPCLHLIRCEICLNGEGINKHFLCPRCASNINGSIRAYIT